jgi:hypothetical protein
MQDSKKLQDIINSFPEEVKEFIRESIFSPSLLEDNHEEYLFLVFLEILNHCLSFYRYRITGEPIFSKKGNPPSLFTMSFMPSGAKKDVGLNLINSKLFNNLYEDMEIKINKYLDTLKNKLENKATERYPDEKAQIQRASYLERLEDKYIRKPNIFSTNSTMEGLHSDRRIFQEMGYGASFYLVKEISNYYSKHSDTKASLDAYLLESSETGDTTGKSIKSDKEITSIQNVPVSVHMHGTIESNKIPPALLTFLKEGGARRVFVFYTDKRKEPLNLDAMSDEEIEKYVLSREEKKEKPKFKKFAKFLTNTVIENRKKVYKFSRESRILYKVESLKAKREKNEDYKNHIYDIPFRALKMSLGIQVLMNPKSEFIEFETYQISLQLTQFYAEFYKKLIEFNDVTLEQESINIISKAGKITYTELKRKLKKEIRNDEQFKQSILDYAKSESIDIELVQTSRGVSFTTKEPKKKATDKSIKISISKTLDPHSTDFTPKNIKWSEMKNITGENISWSATTFKNNKRKDENAESFSIIGLDIDNGMSLEDAKKFFTDKKLECLISTTKSHNIEKNGVIADRFRIVLLLDKEYKLDKQEFKNRMVNLYNDLNLPFDRSTQNISRLWFGNAKAEHYHITGFSLNFDDYKTKEVKEIKTIKIFKSASTDKALIDYWIQNGTEGNRYNMLYRAFQYYKDEGKSFYEISEKIHIINNSFSRPHTTDKIDKELDKWRNEFL